MDLCRRRGKKSYDLSTPLLCLFVQFLGGIYISSLSSSSWPPSAKIRNWQKKYWLGTLLAKQAKKPPIKAVPNLPDQSHMQFRHTTSFQSLLINQGEKTEVCVNGWVKASLHLNIHLFFQPRIWTFPAGRSLPSLPLHNSQSSKSRSKACRQH